MRFLLLVALLAGGLLASPAGAEEGYGYALANELMSPFCPGRALAECPSPQADELRLWILDQETAGRSREAVEAELYQAWGDQLLQAPRAEGVGLVAYAVPVVVVVLGGGLVALFLRRQGRASAPAAAPGDPLDPEVERLLERELAEIDA